jgi:tetratricopeptide (TPR) repeat protein
MWISISPIRKVCLLLAIILWLPVAGPATAETVDELRDKALAAFEGADYPTAIDYLKRALAEAPDDAEIYYYLGYFTHYLCYDSVPLSGFGRDKSDEVLGYLRRAVELDPSLGNAYYFIGAEYGARARDEMQAGNSAGAAEQFRRGREKGGFPDWMVEFGRNLLKSCARDAILFTGGDADANAVEYLQVVEKYRTDVTVIPMALLNRPWFVLLLRDGLDGAVRAAPISWSREQIMKMRPYKWQTRTIRIPIAEETRAEYGTDQTAFEWELTADECGGEPTGHLDAGRAILADIFITNRFERPVYFSTGCSPNVWAAWQSHMQLSGIAYHFLPIEAAPDIDVESTTGLLMDEHNFDALPSIRDHDMPRVSGVLNNYRGSYLRLAFVYIQNDNAPSVEALLNAMRDNVPEEAVPIPEGMRGTIAKLEQWVSQER